VSIFFGTPFPGAFSMFILTSEQATKFRNRQPSKLCSSYKKNGQSSGWTPWLQWELYSLTDSCSLFSLPLANDFYDKWIEVKHKTHLAVTCCASGCLFKSRNLTMEMGTGNTIRLQTRQMQINIKSASLTTWLWLRTLCVMPLPLVAEGQALLKTYN
jgi:hypothetical protein